MDKTTLSDETFSFKKRMRTPDRTLILFQFNNHAVASALLKEILHFDKKNIDGYIGEYKFIPSSIKVFKSITTEDKKEVWSDFKGFNQAMQNLDTDQFQKINHLLEVKIKDDSAFQ